MSGYTQSAMEFPRQSAYVEVAKADLIALCDRLLREGQPRASEALFAQASIYKDGAVVTISRSLAERYELI